jgi:hypothetical protein
MLAAALSAVREGATVYLRSRSSSLEYSNITYVAVCIYFVTVVHQAHDGERHLVCVIRRVDVRGEIRQSSSLMTLS